MWARTWAPRPSRTVPVASASSHAVAAVTIGLRGKATTMPVSTSMSAATARAPHVGYAVRARLGDHEPQSPASAARLPSVPTWRSGWADSMASNFSGPVPPSYTPPRAT